MSRPLAAKPLWLRAAGALSIVTLSACQRASFESLGTLVTKTPTVSTLPDAGTPIVPPLELDAGQAQNAADAQAPGAGAVSVPKSGAAGVPMPAAGSGGAAAAMAPHDPLRGSLDSRPFDAVKSGFVIGYPEELEDTTLYLIDSAVSCSEISTFAWLNQLPPTTQVIELVFPSDAALGSSVSDSLISYARGGMYSFSKTRASAYTLVLTQNNTAGAVEGTLAATFSSGAVSGTFHADFCATGLDF